MTSPKGYSVSGYGAMIADRVRTEAYARALRQVCTPDSVVLDIGAGTGIFSLLACRYGARKVYAIEPDDSIALAREVAAANNYAERISFIQDISTQVSLPEPADILICDLHGVLSLYEQHIPTIVDARARLLTPDAVLIPYQENLWVSLAETPQDYGKLVNPWDERPDGFNMQPVRSIVTSSLCKVNLQRDQLLTEPQRWHTLDYASIQDPNAHGKLTFRSRRAGTFHGITVWFDSQLADDVSFSNAPGKPEMIYGQAFFPLQAPIVLSEGDCIDVTLHADLTGLDYTWRWETQVWDTSRPANPKAHYKQSTFYGAILSMKTLRRQSADFVPVLNADGEVARAMLSMMDGNTSLEAVVRRSMEQFPDHFRSWQEALSYAAELAKQYS